MQLGDARAILRTTTSIFTSPRAKRTLRFICLTKSLCGFDYVSGKFRKYRQTNVFFFVLVTTGYCKRGVRCGEAREDRLMRCTPAIHLSCRAHEGDIRGSQARVSHSSILQLCWGRQITVSAVRECSDVLYLSLSLSRLRGSVQLIIFSLFDAIL